MSEWSVRDEEKGTETGFGSAELIATKAYNGLVEKARITGIGGSFTLKKDGAVVMSAFVPGRGEP